MARKVLQFLKEMELVEKGFMFPLANICSASHAEPSSTNALHCSALRTALNDSLWAMCQEMGVTLEQLRKSLPVTELWESDSHYVKWEVFASRLEKEDSESLTLLKELFNIWCILCSQLCRRLLIGVYSSTDPQKMLNAFKNLTKSLTKTKECHRTIETNFRYYTSWSLNNSAPRSSEIVNGLSVSVQSLQSHLTALFLISNRLLCVINSDKVEIEQLLVKIKQEQINISATIQSTIAELEKMCYVPTISCAVEAKVELKVDEEPLVVMDENFVEVNEDEVLEAYVSKEDRTLDECDEFIMSREEYKKLIQEKKQQSKFMLSELQNILKGRAEDWAEREAKARMKKYGVEVIPDKAVNEEGNESKTFLTGSDAVCEMIEKVEIEEKDFECDGTESIGSQDEIRFSNYREPSNIFLGASLASEMKSLFPSRQIEEEILGDSSSEDEL